MTLCDVSRGSERTARASRPWPFLLNHKEILVSELQVLAEGRDLHRGGGTGAICIVGERTGRPVIDDPILPVLRLRSLDEHVSRDRLRAGRTARTQFGEDLVVEADRIVGRIEVVDPIEIARLARLGVEHEGVPARTAMELVVACTAKKDVVSVVPEQRIGAG